MTGLSRKAATAGTADTVAGLPLGGDPGYWRLNYRRQDCFPGGGLSYAGSRKRGRAGVTLPLALLLRSSFRHYSPETTPTENFADRRTTAYCWRPQPAGGARHEVAEDPLPVTRSEVR